MSDIQLRQISVIGDISLRVICSDGVPLLLPTQYLRSVATIHGPTNTSNTYATALLLFFRWLDSKNIQLDNITRIHLQQYLNYLQTQTLAASSVKQYMSTAVRFIHWCMEPSDQDKLLRRKQKSWTDSTEQRGLLSGIARSELVYVTGLIPRTKKRIPRALSWDELQMIRSWITQTYADDRALQTLYRLIVELLWDGALRRGELLSLKMDCLQRGGLLVQNLPDSFDKAYAQRLGAALKTGERWIPISNFTVQLIHRWKTELRPPEAFYQGHEFLLTNLHPARLGKPLGINALRWLFDRLNHPHYGVKLKSGRIHPHLFRHTFATLAINDGVDLSTLRMYLGHRLISSTQMYVQVSKEVLRETIDVWRHKHHQRYGGLL